MSLLLILSRLRFRTFRDHPEYRSMFSYKNIPENNWLDNQIFLKSMGTSIEAFTAIIDNINDSVKLESILSKVVESHKRRKVTEEHFVVSTQSTLDV